MDQAARDKQLARARESTTWYAKKHDGIDYDGSVRPSTSKPGPDFVRVKMQDGSELTPEDNADLLATVGVVPPPKKRRRFSGTTIVEATLTIKVRCDKEEVPNTDGERDVSKRDLKLLDAVIGFCERNKIECQCLVEVADGVF